MPGAGAEVHGPPADERYFRQVTELGAAIADGGFPGLEGIDAGEILMRYDGAS